MDNLFIIRSPLQLIGAKEAINRFKLDNNILLIIDTKGQINTEQIDKLLDKESWKDIIRLKADRKSNFFKYLKLIKTLKRNKYNYLFSGDYGSIHQILMANLDAKSIYLLDDGLETVEIYDELIKNKVNFKKEIKRKLRFLLFGLKIKISKTINFFTMFNLTEFGDTKIVKHNFECLKKEYKLQEKEKEKELYILGQPFVKYNWLDQKHYFNYIKHIINEYKEYKIKYLFHRDEDMKYLKDSFPKLETITNDIPSEIMFMNMEKIPSHIVSMQSTLLFSLNCIFPNINVKSYKSDRFNFNKENIALVYKYIEDNNIEVKELK